MKKIITASGYTKLWLSPDDTYNWAHDASARCWPCSFLAGKPLFAEFDQNGDLIDMAIDYGRGDQDCPSDEFNAITSDFLKQG